MGSAFKLVTDALDKSEKLDDMREVHRRIHVYRLIKSEVEGRILVAEAESGIKTEDGKT